jgi:hypothetical protein
VVEVAVSSGHAAARKNAVFVSSLDTSALRCRWAPAGGSGVNSLPGLRVGHGVAPLGIVLILCDLARNVCNGGCEAVEFPRVIGEVCKSVEADRHVHDTSGCGAVSGSSEEIEVDVRAQPVHGAGLAVAP